MAFVVASAHGDASEAGRTRHERRGPRSDSEGDRRGALSGRQMLLTVACYAEAGQEGEPSMTVHFTSEELAERRRRALEAMAVRGLDALLMFKQEKYVSPPFHGIPLD
jgi:hypothetical protein